MTKQHNATRVAMAILFAVAVALGVMFPRLPVPNAVVIDGGAQSVRYGQHDSIRVQHLLNVMGATDLDSTLNVDGATTLVELTASGDMAIEGTTPMLTIGDGGEEDTTLLYDGAAQDYYIALDDTADDLLIGLGSAVGTTPGLSIDENLAVGTYGDVTMVGTTVILTLGDADEEDVTVLFDGNAQDFYIALDDTADDLLIGLGSAVGTTPGLSIDENLAVGMYGDLTVGGTTPVVTVGDAGEEDTAIVFDGIAQDYYLGLYDTSDDFVIGLGSALGTTPGLGIDENLAVALYGDVTMNGTTPVLTVGDADEEDTIIVFDGNAQDYYLGLYDTDDDFAIGVGSALGTTPGLTIDENLAVGTYGDVTMGGTTVVLTIGDDDEEDILVIFDGHSGGQNYYMGVYDSADDFQIGVGSALNTTVGLSIDENLAVGTFGDVTMGGTTPVLTIGDAGEEDVVVIFDGHSGGQDYYLGLYDTADDLILGLGGAIGTTGIIYLDENQDVGLGGASAGTKLDVTGNAMIDGAADEIQFLIQGNATQTTSSFVIEDSGGTDVFVVTEMPVAGAGGDLLDLTDTTAIMDGTDTIIGIDLNITGADHTGSTNFIYGIDLDLTTPDEHATEIAIELSDTDWDIGIQGAENLEHFMFPTILAVDFTYTASAGGTVVLATIADGEIWLVHSVIIRVTTNFDCTGEDCVMVIGDDTDTDGFCALADGELQAADTEGTGWAAGFQCQVAATQGVWVTEPGGFWYAPSGAAQTIDVVMTAAGNDFSAGAATGYVHYTRIQ